MDQEKKTYTALLMNLFTSRVRLKILSIFLPKIDEMYYVRQVTRMTGEEVNAVRRELDRLKRTGLLTTEQRANRLYYRVRTDFPFYYDLLRMVGKVTGLGAEIIKQSPELGKIKFAMISALLLRGRPSSPNNIDAIFVGQLNVDRLQGIVRRKTRGDAFVRSVLSQPQIVLIGDEEDLNKGLG
jgi:hypothetical protein